MNSRRIAAVIAGIATTTAGALHAQTAASSSPVALSEAADADIVVTARRREEKAQDLPIAVTAISAEQIRNQGIDTLDDVAKRVPGLFFTQGLSTGDFRPAIRGMQVVRTAAQPSVGVYVDGIDTGYGLGFNIQTFDVQQIEVVRGPQSALFGRSVIGGAVNYISRRPSSTFEGNFGGVIAEGGQREVSGRVSGPVADGFALSLAARYKERDGFYRNLANGSNAGDAESSTVVFGALLEPNDAFRAYFRFFGSDEYDGQPAWNNVASNTTVPRNAPLTPTPWFVGEVPTSAALVRNNTHTYIDYAGYDREYRRGSLILDYDFGFATLTSTTAVNESKVRFDQDTDFSFAPAFLAGTSVFGDFRGKFDEKAEDQSQELRLTSVSGRPFRWLVGGYYANEDVQRSTFNFTEVTLNPARARISPQNREAKTLAAFGSVDIDLSDRFTVGAELRWNRDKLSANTIERITTTDVVFAGSDTFESTTWRLTALYDLTDNLRAYANVARGFKPGGFNIASGAGSISLPANLRTFRPEHATAYEAGIKSELLDRRLILNLAAFAIDWTDLQVGATFGTPPFTAGYTTNAGKVRIRGFEAEAQARVADGVDLSFSLSHQPAKISGFVDSRTAALARVGDKLPGSPETTASGSLQLSHEFNDRLEIFGSADVRYRSSFFATNANLAETGPATTVDVQAGARFGSIRATVFVSNLTNDKTATALNAFVNPTTFVRSFLVALPDPRHVGLRLNFDF